MNIDKKLEIPLYVKSTILIVGIFAFIEVLYIGSSIIVPLVFSLIIAIVLHPVVNFFMRFKANRLLAIILSTFIVILLIALLSTLIISQVSHLADSWPSLVNNFTELINSTITWSSNYFEITPQKTKEYIAQIQDSFITIGSDTLGNALLSVGNVLVIMLLIPIYVFMILFYHPLLIDFIHRLFSKDKQEKVNEIVSQIKTVIQRYLVGLMIEFAIMATLYTIVLLIFGIDFALLLALMGALINMIPYVGGLVGVFLPVMVALATKPSPWSALYIMVGIYVIQLIDNNFIVPKIVASKVKINALFSIIVVIAGNALWGIPGMFLAIPLLGIIKLMCDQIEPLKPWGFLLGDTFPSNTNTKINP